MSISEHFTFAPKMSSRTVMVKNLIKMRTLAPRKLLDYGQGGIKTDNIVWKYKF